MLVNTVVLCFNVKKCNVIKYEGFTKYNKIHVYHFIAFLTIKYCFEKGRTLEKKPYPITNY